MPGRPLHRFGDGLVAGDARAQWRLLALLWSLGGVLAVVASLAGLSRAADLDAILALGVASIAAGAVIVAFSGHLDERLLGPVLVLGTTVVGAATVAGGEAGTPFAIFFTWVGAEAWYFLGYRDAVAYTAYAIAVSAIVTLLLPASGAFAWWLLSSGSLVVIGTMSACLRIRSDRLIADLRAAAVSDGLTGVLNLRGFDARLDEELARARRSATQLSVVLVDLDAFKRLNDVFGHRAGDRVLRSFSDLCRRELREIDLIGRLGGDEFAFVLPETGVDGALAAASRLRDVLRDELRAPDGTYVTVSVGVGCFPSHATTGELLRQAAGEALYRAKSEGRDRAVAFTVDAAVAARRA